MIKLITAKLISAEATLRVVLKECEVELPDSYAKKDIIKQLRRAELEAHYAVKSWERYCLILQRQNEAAKGVSDEN